MPYLSPEDRALLLGPTGHTCPRCAVEQIKNYCRSCDEFFVFCGCPESAAEHRGHRLYTYGEPVDVATQALDELSQLTADELQRLEEDDDD